MSHNRTCQNGTKARHGEHCDLRGKNSWHLFDRDTCPRDRGTGLRAALRRALAGTILGMALTRAAARGARTEDPAVDSGKEITRCGERH